MGLDRGSKLGCTLVLGGSKGRCFQRLQIPIDPVWRPFVPFGAQFSFQLCSRATPLRPSLQEIGDVQDQGDWLVVVSGERRGWFPSRSSVEEFAGSSPASWPSQRSSSRVFVVLRCVHTEPCARLD